MAKLDIKLLIEDYEHKSSQLSIIMDELEKLSNEIIETKEMLKIKGVGIATTSVFMVKVGILNVLNYLNKFRNMQDYH